jgi:hypothetical protein
MKAILQASALNQEGAASGGVVNATTKKLLWAKVLVKIAGGEH